MNMIFKAVVAFSICVSFVAVAGILTFNSVSSAAPLIAFNRWGNSLVDGNNESGHALSAWIDGVKYGQFITTGKANNTDIFVNGTDWNPSGINKAKTGGEDGDRIIYRLETSAGTLIANEIDPFQSGGTEHNDLHFVSAQEKEINGLKLFKLFVNPAQGSCRVVVKNTGASSVTVDNNWKVKADGAVPGNYDGWMVVLGNGNIAAGGTLEIDLGSQTLNATNGDLELCWKDTLGNIANGEWVVMDRAEWASTISSHDGSPGNTTMIDKMGPIPGGYHLERKLAGAQDTDNCDADFAVVTDSAGAKFDVTVTDPATGVSWKAGTTHSVNWTVYGSVANTTAYLNLSSDAGTTYSPIHVQNHSSGTYDWAIPQSQAPGAHYVIKIDLIDNLNLSSKASNTSGEFMITGAAGLAYVSLFPHSPVIIYINAQQAFLAQAFDTTGNPIASGVTYAWTTTGGIGSMSPATAGTSTFTASGAGAAGSINITATYGNEVATNSTMVNVTTIKPVLNRINVAPAGPLTLTTGQMKVFNATGETAGGAVIGGVTLDWTAEPTAIGTLSASAGPTSTFTAGSVPGTGNITVNGTYEGATKQAQVNMTVTVSSGAIHRIAVSPPNVTVQVNKTQEFTAVAYDAASNPISGVTFTWSVVPAVRGDILPNGTFTAKSVGNCTVRATSGGITGQTNVTVSNYEPWTLSYLTISPASAENMQIDSQMTFTVTAYAANNTTIPAKVLQYQWTRSWTGIGIGTLAPKGGTCNFTATQEGSGIITATVTCNGISKSINVTLSVQPNGTGLGTMLLAGIAVALIAIILVIVLFFTRSKKGKGRADDDSRESIADNKEKGETTKKTEDNHEKPKDKATPKTDTAKEPGKPAKDEKKEPPKEETGK